MELAHAMTVMYQVCMLRLYSAFLAVAVMLSGTFAAMQSSTTDATEESG